MAEHIFNLNSTAHIKKKMSWEFFKLVWDKHNQKSRNKFCKSVLWDGRIWLELSENLNSIKYLYKEKLFMKRHNEIF